MFEFMLTRTEMAKLLLSSINCFQLHNLFLLFNSNLYVDFNYTFFELLLLSISQKCAFTIMQIINVLSEIDFKCQRKHQIILFWWNISINWCMNYFSDTPNPETQLSKDGSGAGFKVGKVKLHFEVHGLAFSIISCSACHQQAWATLWLFSLDLL